MSMFGEVSDGGIGSIFSSSCLTLPFVPHVFSTASLTPSSPMDGKRRSNPTVPCRPPWPPLALAAMDGAPRSSAPAVVHAGTARRRGPPLHPAGSLHLPGT